MWTHFDGLRNNFPLKTFYDFLTRHFKKRNFLKSEKKRIIRILEHWSDYTLQIAVHVLLVVFIIDNNSNAKDTPQFSTNFL